MIYTFIFDIIFNIVRISVCLCDCAAVSSGIDKVS